MKNIKKLVFSVAILISLFGCKTVFAEGQENDADLSSGYESVSAETGVDVSGMNVSISEEESTNGTNDTTIVDIGIAEDEKSGIIEDIADSNQTENQSETDAQVPSENTSENTVSNDENKTDSSPEQTEAGESETGEGENNNSTDTSTPTEKHLTILNGVDYSLIYDYDYYSLNEDVREAFGDDEEATLYNFVRWGMARQRQGIASFDEISYRYAYQDLRLAYGNDYQAYYLHYIRYGNQEGRSMTTGITEILNPVTTEGGVDYSLVYDYKYYSSNPDVKAEFGDDDIATLHNFVRWGMAGQRQGNATFDEKSYRYAYQDLRQAYRLNYASYYLHYINYGYKEGRNQIKGITSMQNPTTVFAGANYPGLYKNNTFSFDLSPVYDYLYYTENNPTLNNLDDDFAMIENFAVNGLINWVCAKNTMSDDEYVFFRDTVIPFTKNDKKTYVTIGIAWGYEVNSLKWYTSALSNAGARYILLEQFTTVEQASSALASIDGVILTGGNDITPSVYGESTIYAYNCNYARDLSDICLVQAAYALDKPTLGICRGLQIMNVAFNDLSAGNFLGTLYQDLNSQGASSFSHLGNANVEEKRHEVYFNSESMIATIYGTTTLSVTSTHHEGIKELDTSHYVATGYATVGGTIIEAIEGIGRTFFIGIQFHPEALAASGEVESMKIFKALVEKTIGKCGDNLTWSYADGILTISGTGQMTDYSINAIDMPWYNMYINGETQSGMDLIRTINIKEGVTTIGSAAFFYCRNLTSINIPDSVSNIGHDAFSYCLSLKEITIPDGVTSIADQIFAMCISLEKITIPSSVTIFGNNAFYACKNLKDIYYLGTEEQWSVISDTHMVSSDAEIHYEPDSVDQPQIEVQPVNATAALKTKVEFSVSADHVLSYQWQYSKNDGATWHSLKDSSLTFLFSSGCTSDTLTLLVNNTRSGFLYRCRLTGEDGTVEYTDQVAILLFTITEQPTSVQSKSASAVTFNVGTQNAESYQWYYQKEGSTKWYKLTDNEKSSMLISGSTTDTMTIRMTKTRLKFKYRCKVKGKDGTYKYTDIVEILSELL